ncbi:MAG: DUF6812 domain-containing protein [Trueperaceae bacterium]
MYKAPTVATPARVFTTTHRIHGYVHTPPQADLASVMNHTRPFLALTQCRIYKHSLSLTETALASSEFLIILKENVLWVAEPETDALEVRRSQRNVYLLYTDYVLKGEINVPPHVRISDFLVRALHEKAFQYLHRVEVRLLQKGGLLESSQIKERHDVALVNLRQVAGVYDISEDSSKPELLTNSV